jgi:hypothetical protein
MSIETQAQEPQFHATEAQDSQFAPTQDHSEGESSIFDELLHSAQEGETLVDPRVGKYDDAILIEVTQAGEGDKLHPRLTWGALHPADGSPEFTQRDDLYLPQVHHPVFVKQRFMAKLKELGIVPQTYKQIIYFTPSQVPLLVETIRAKCLGQVWPITLTQDDQGFMKITMRKRPRELSPN